MANSAFFVEALTLGQSESSHHMSYFRIINVNIQSLRTWFIRLSSVINMLKRSLSKAQVRLIWDGMLLLQRA